MRTLFRAGAAAAAIASVVTGAAAQEKVLAEKSVVAYMDYAWSLTPKKFTKPNGTVVEIDKAQRDKMTVPVDTARDVILAARMTAHAQLCELPQEQVDNYRSLMKREDLKKKWSEQQMIFINQLHLTTVMLLTGKIRLVEQQDGNKQVVLEEGKTVEQKPCTEEQRKKVKEIVTAYVAAGPSLAAAAAPPATTGAIAPATAAAPAPKKQ